MDCIGTGYGHGHGHGHGGKGYGHGGKGYGHGRTHVKGYESKYSTGYSSPSHTAVSGHSGRGT